MDPGLARAVTREGESTDAEIGALVVKRTLSLVRAGVTPEAALPVVASAAGGNRMALHLARSRVLAILDAEPADARARQALDILSAALGPEG
ncbi:MAG: hypothetical protein ACRDJG_00815 [Actinomycetota bacterium]